MVRITALAGAALLAACAPAIRSQRDEAIPVPQGATWAWAAPDTGGPADSTGKALPGRGARGARPLSGQDPSGINAIPRQRFQRALEAALAARGFHKVDTLSQPDFLLTLTLGTPGRFNLGGPVGAVTAVSVGWYGGFGGPRGRFGRYGPWGGWGYAGWYQPWGFGWYGMPMYAMPMYGMATAYPMYPGGSRGTTVVALLRLRSSGEVAWRAQYRADAYDLAYLTPRHAREIADKLVASLR
jgi:hypothetical protein